MASTASGSGAPDSVTSPQMPHIEPKRYAVVSCHVERPLDDRAWEAFARIQVQRPGGFAIAALIRPARPGRG